MSLNLYHTIPTFNDPKEEGLGKHCGKGENPGNQHFLLLPTVFSALSKRKILILATFNLSYANAFNLVTSKKKVLFGIQLNTFLNWGSESITLLCVGK